MVGNEGDSDEIADELRACSKLEFELQAQMRSVSEALTKAEVEAAHLGDRRAEAEREMTAIVEKLGEAVPPAEAAMTEEERGRDRPPARAARPPPRPDRPGQPARRARIRRGDRPRRAAAGPARGHRAGDARAGVADPRNRRRDRARLRGDLRGDRDELRGDGRTPLPRRPRPAAPGQPAAGPRRRAARRASRRTPSDDNEPEPTRRRTKSATSSGSRSRSTRRASRRANCR